MDIPASSHPPDGDSRPDAADVITPDADGDGLFRQAAVIRVTRQGDPAWGYADPERVENRHAAWLVVTDADGRVQSASPGARQAACFFRSAAKPFQAVPLVESGLASQLGEEALALAAASHSGSARHLAVLAETFKRLEALGQTPLDPESLLQCGAHPPLDEAEARRLTATGEAPRRVHNNCSGKHAGMVGYCLAQGLPTAHYLAPDHPLQQRIVEVLKTHAGTGEIPVAMDGCGAPTHYLPLSAMARLYARLATDADLAPVARAMTRHPELVGGDSGRVDTALMLASGGQLLAKVGADGLICVSHRPRGLGLALKIADGSGPIRDLAIAQVLHALGWLEAAAWAHPALAPWREPVRVNTQGRVVGRIDVSALITHGEIG